MEPRGDRLAFGHPGTALFGAPSRKDGFGTAYSADSQLWYTMWRGVVTEVYYPTIDRPKLRGIEYVVTDGDTFLHDEAVHMESTIERPHEHALGYRVQSRDPEGRYTID
ncbi:Glucodextranase N domain protein, partial [mine drainage metagenome]